MNFGYYRTGPVPVPDEEELKIMILDAVKEERFVFYDEITGLNSREQYHLLLKLLRKGDCLYLDRLDSLGYSYAQIAEQWRIITEEIGAEIIILDSKGYLNNQKNIRQNNGAEPVTQGRKKNDRKSVEIDELFFDEIAMRWLKRELTAEEACEMVGCSRTTWYKYTKERGYYLKTKKHKVR